MNITEKTAYLKGLMAGLNIDESKPEGKLLTAIVETLDEMANEIADLGDVAEYLEDYIDEVDHDLGDLETEYEKRNGDYIRTEQKGAYRK